MVIDTLAVLAILGDIIVVNESVQENGVAEQVEPVGWPSGAYAATAGAWQGEPLVREPQGDYEVRAEDAVEKSEQKNGSA